VREPGSCPYTGYLNWFGTARVTKQQLQDEGGFEDKPGMSHLQLDRTTSRHHASSSSFSSYACHEEEIFRVGHVNRSKHHPIRSEHGPLALTEVLCTPLEVTHIAKDNEEPHIKRRFQPTLRFPVVFCGNYHTAGNGE